MTQARSHLLSFLKSIIQERKDRNCTESCMFQTMLTAIQDPNSRESVRKMDDATLLDNLLGMWFGFFETNSTNLVWILKYLLDYPEIYQRVKVRSVWRKVHPEF